MLRLTRLVPTARQGLLAARYSTESGPIHGKKDKARALRDAVVGAGRAKSLSLSQLDSVLDGNVRRGGRRRDDGPMEGGRDRGSSFSGRSDRGSFSDRGGRRDDYSRSDRSDRPFRPRDDVDRPRGGGFARRDGGGGGGFNRGGDRRDDRGSFARRAAAGAGASFARNRDGGGFRDGGFRDGDRRSHRRGDDWVDRNADKGTSSNPFTLSIKIKKFLERHPDKLSRPQVDELIGMATSATPAMSTAPVWNLIFSRIGRDGYYTAMWKAFNLVCGRSSGTGQANAQMKKRGTHASSRTFTVMLNAYAGVAHSGVVNDTFAPANRPENLTLERVRRIYDLSQAHIRGVLAKAKRGGRSRDDLGVAYPEMDGEEGEFGAQPDAEGEVSVFATNAYLKFLGRYGMWKEMEGVFLAMDKEGALAPDQVTYYIMLNTANEMDHYRRGPGEFKAALPEIDVGAVGRGYFDQAVRRLCTSKTERGIDNGLALAALSCFAAGSPADQRVAEDLVPRLWNLPAPGQPASAGGVNGTYNLPKAWTDVLPTLNLDVRTATSLLSTLRRLGNKSLVAHYTRLMAEDTTLRRNADLALLRVLAHNLAYAGDADGAQAILDTFQPPSGPDGWPVDVYLGVLGAARWAADWDVALSTFRRMVALPPGVERGEQTGEYVWTPPNGSKSDVRRRLWVEPRPHRVNATSMSLLFKTALAAHKRTGIKPLRAAADIYEWYGPATFFSVRTSAGDVDMNAGEAKHWDLSRRDIGAIADAVDLARDLEIVAERLIELPRAPGDVERHEAMRRDAQRVVRIWGKTVEERGAGRGEKERKPKPRFLRSLE